MRINEIYEKAEFLKLNENFVLNTDDIVNYHFGISQKFGNKQVTLFLRENKAVTISEPLFIALKQAEKETEATEFKFKKETTSDGFQKWVPIPLNGKQKDIEQDLYPILF